MAGDRALDMTVSKTSRRPAGRIQADDVPAALVDDGGHSGRSCDR